MQEFAQKDKSGDLRNSEAPGDAAEDGEGGVLGTVGVKVREQLPEEGVTGGEMLVFEGVEERRQLSGLPMDGG